LLKLSKGNEGLVVAVAEIPKVLKPFSQVSDIMTRTHEGTGLGLSLSKSLTELHGGTLEIESEPGVGAAITIRFPPERAIRQT
jgi:signal transduction histidine kinase